MNPLNLLKKFDMFNDKTEHFYGKVYLDKIFSSIQTEFGSKKLRVLDAGCQAGRIAIPLAEAGHTVIAIDSDVKSIKMARQNAEIKNVKANFIVGDLTLELEKLETNSFDVIVCTEVLYSNNAPDKMFRQLARLLARPGLLFSSHRTKYYYVSLALLKKDFDTALLILDKSSGVIDGGSYNWQNPAEIRNLFQENDIGLQDLKGVGLFSGTWPDSFSKIVDPQKLNEKELEKLGRIEAEQWGDCIGCARYILAIGKK